MVTIDTIGSTQTLETENVGERSRGKHIRLRTGRLVQAIAQWWRTRSTRQGLAELDEDLLRDIGVTPQEARDEMNKSLYLLHEKSGISLRTRDLPRHDRW